MKVAAASVLLIIWMVISLLLAVTLLGLVVVIDEDWQSIPGKLLKVFEPTK